MKVFVDENVHRRVVIGLRDLGFAVEWLLETMPSADDSVILERPDIGSAVLVTYDRDFGELIYKHGMPHPRAVIYSRLDRPKADKALDRICAVLNNEGLEGQFVVITENDERWRPLPGERQP
jgi:predicted nuclease of predicted toxin-antitoxin system